MGNRHLQGEREQIYADMAGWWPRNKQPVIGVEPNDERKETFDANASQLPK